MAKVALPEYMREDRAGVQTTCGPFVTISRQFGCYGFSLGLLLQDILNEQSESPNVWRVYNRDILSRLATQTNLTEEILDWERRSRPHCIVDFFRMIGGEHIPYGFEIRKRITSIIGGLAMQGHAIIIGQGGAGACSNLPNGLSVRLEAPEDWRVKQVAYRDALSPEQARMRILAKEQEREYLRQLYERHFPHKPAFNLVYDASVFSLAQIARHLVCAMRVKGLLDL